MITNFKELITAAKREQLPTLAVAVAQDLKILKAVKLASELGLARAVLVGNKAEIEAFAKEAELDLSEHQIVDVADKAEACLTAVKLVRDGKADVPMKGLVETSVMLRAVLNKEHGLRGGKLLSHVGVLEVSDLDRLLVLSDSAMNIAPNVDDKTVIIENSLEVALALGLAEPKIAVLSASESVNEKMPSTVDAARLAAMNKEDGRFKPAIVSGPFALDNAVSKEAARIKGIDDPVAGQADVLIVPNIEAGNLLNKSLEYFAHAEKAGVIMGALAPIVLTSRASSEYSKMHSIALALLIHETSSKEK